MSKLAKWVALVGGGVGSATTLIVWSGQMSLRDVLSGQLPLSVAVTLGGNSFVFLSILLLLYVIGIVTSLQRKLSSIWTGSIWLGIGGILIYMAYISRFSAGLLLVPSATLFIIAAILALFSSSR